MLPPPSQVNSAHKKLICRGRGARASGASGAGGSLVNDQISAHNPSQNCPSQKQIQYDDGTFVSLLVGDDGREEVHDKANRNDNQANDRIGTRCHHGNSKRGNPELSHSFETNLIPILMTL